MAQSRRKKFSWRQLVTLLVVLLGLLVLAQRLRDLLIPAHPQSTLSIVEIPLLPSQGNSTQLPGQFYVQVIDPATSDASGLVQRLQQAGYRPTAAASREQPRVLVGPYRSRSEAEAALDEIRVRLRTAP